MLINNVGIAITRVFVEEHYVTWIFARADGALAVLPSEVD